MNVRTGKRTLLERTCVDFITAHLDDAVHERGRAVLGLPGGRSVSALLQGLAVSAISWERVHIFLADERFVPLDSDERNYKEIRSLLVEPLVVARKTPESNAHPFRYDGSRPDGGVDSYTADFRAMADRFDVLVLGAGEDGHAASLFPRHPSVSSDGEWFIRVDDAPKLPPARMSVSPAMLARSRSAVVLFFGDAKADAYRSFRSAGPVEECPARLAKSIDDCLVVTDTETE